PRSEGGRPVPRGGARALDRGNPLPELGQGGAAGRSRGDASGEGPARAPDGPRALRDADPHGPQRGASRSEDGPLEPRGSPPPRPRPPPPGEADDPRREQGGSRDRKSTR